MRNKISWTLIISATIFFSCQENVLSYESAMRKCMENVEVSEFTISNGKKGQSFQNFNISCIKGGKLPLLKAETISGEKIETKNLKGKVNIINFWFASCKPCIAEIPGLNILAEKYKEAPINFLAISLDDEELLTKHLESNKFDFTHLVNGKEIIRNKFLHKGGFPTTIITNKHLEIIEAFEGGKSNSSAVEEIIEKIEPIINDLIQ